jgi:polyisoprenoid-binding protein YceI
MSTTTDINVSTGTWTLDPTHTEIGFTVRHIISKVRGKFETFEGTLVTTDDITDSSVKVSFDLSSINTGTQQRDDHLRSSDFFDAENQDHATFVSTGVVAKSGTEFVVTGD